MTQIGIRQWISFAAATAASLLFLASLAAAQVKPTETKSTTKQGPVKTEAQCRPATPEGKGTCQAQIDCPPLKNPGQTTCQVTIDCPKK